MKRLANAIVATIFVLAHSPNGDCVRTYEGQSQKTIKSLLAGEGITGEFISQTQYQTFIEAHKPAQPSAAERLTQTADMAQAKKDLNDKTKTTDQRLDAMIKYLGLQ